MGRSVIEVMHQAQGTSQRDLATQSFACQGFQTNLGMFRKVCGALRVSRCGSLHGYLRSFQPVVFPLRMCYNQKDQVDYTIIAL